MVAGDSGYPSILNFASEYAKVAIRYIEERLCKALGVLFHRDHPLRSEFRDLAKNFRAEPEFVDGILCSRRISSRSLFSTVRGLKRSLGINIKENGRQEEGCPLGQVIDV